MTPEERQRIIEEEKIRTIVREKEKAKVDLTVTGIVIVLALIVLTVLYSVMPHK